MRRLNKEEYNLTKEFNGFDNEYQAKTFAIMLRQNEIEASYNPKNNSVIIYIERSHEMPWVEDEVINKANEIYNDFVSTKFRNVNENKAKRNIKKKITESQLRNIIVESIKTALYEN